MAAISRIFQYFLVIFLAIFVIISGLAESATRNKQYDYAVRLFGDNGESWARLASAFSAAGKNDQANAAARRALVYSLGHVEALRVLGIAEYNAGQKDKGYKLVSLASALSLRDSPAQSWLFEQELAKGNFAKAMRHADALLRREKVQDEIFWIFNLVAMDDRFRAPLIKQFETNPNWRARYFAFAKRTPDTQYQGVENIVEGLQNTKTPASPKELTPYVSMLLGKKKFTKALTLWDQYFADKPSGKTTNLGWPDGWDISNQLPIDWRLTANSNIRTAIIKGDNGENTLSLDINRNAQGEVAWRYLLARPGLMTIRLSPGNDDQQRTKGIRWAARCLPDGKKRSFRKSSADPHAWDIELPKKCNAIRLILALELGGASKDRSLLLTTTQITN